METYNSEEGTGFNSNSDPNEIPGQKHSDNEIPEREQADNERSEYPHEQEVQQHEDGNDASYSEQTGVTPPKEHEFPSEGRTTTDFTPGNHGRTTGRMVGHEPGTEGI